MSAVDIYFFGFDIIVLALMLVLSPIIRAIAWESLRHPFTNSVIEYGDGQVFIRQPDQIDQVDIQSRPELSDADGRQRKQVPDTFGNQR